MKRNVFSLAVMVCTFALLQLTVSEASAYSASVDKTTLTEGECLTLSWSGFGDTTNLAVYKGSTFWTYANTNAPYAGTQQICTSGWEYRNDYKIRVELKSNTTIYVYSQIFAVLGPKPYLFDFIINGGASSTTSQTVSLQFNFITANPTHYMASENSNFSGASWVLYSTSTVNFTLSSSPEMKFVYFKLKNDWGESNSKWDNISYDPILYNYISGYVKDASGQGIENVTLGGFPNGSATTIGSGYSIKNGVISTSSFTVTPNKSGYTFDPSSRSYSNLPNNLNNQNFTAIPTESYYWYTGSWSACTDICGGGQKTRTVECRRSSDQQVMSDSYCSGSKPDEVSTDCDLGPSRLINPTMNGEEYTSP